jgi:protein-tyrosine kinase
MSEALEQATAELHGLALTLLGLPAPRTVFVTSSREGEGKTFVATSLARLAARLTRGHVLLVDANFDRPSLHLRFGAPDRPGLSEALEAGTSGAIHPAVTDLGNLRVLPAGARAQPALLFQPDVIRPVLAELAARNELVIIDGGTTLAAGAVAQCAAATLLVADCQDTRREAASGALARLKLPRERVLGAVLNRKRHYIPAALYQRL